MTSVITSNRLDAAIQLLSRIERLPRVRRRGDPEFYREPLYQGETEEKWHKSGIFDDGGSLLQLAARAALSVTRWHLRTACSVGQMSADELWARRIKNFDAAFGEKPRYQLIEVLEATVHSGMDLPTLPIYPYGMFLPEWEEVLFGEPATVHDIRSRHARIHVEVRDSGRCKFIGFSLYDYAPNKLLELDISQGVPDGGENWGCGYTLNGSPFEKWHINWLRSILERLVEGGSVPRGVVDAELKKLLEMAKPDVHRPEP